MFFLSDDPLFSDEELLLMCAASGGKTVEDTATGNPLTFTTDIAKPLKSLLIPFTPQQEGTGDPSPSNIRPIVPWDGLTVWHGGKNLFDVSSYPFTASRRISGADGTVGSNSAFKATLDFIPCDDFAGKTVTLNKRCGGNAPGIGFYSSADESAFVSGVRNDGSSAGNPWTFIVPSDAKFMRFTVSVDYATDIQIELGSQSTAYEPYKPITETDISFPSPVYGGTLDVVSGVLKVEWTLFTAKWKNGASTGIIGGTVERKAFSMPVTFVNASVSTSAYCNVAKWKWNFEEESIHFYSNASMSYVFLPNDTDGETDIQIVGKLATPQEIPLTGAQLAAIVGDNTIWSDADGSMTAVYLKKG